MARSVYCPQCKEHGEALAQFCTKCGNKLIPLMRIVIMPFVESEQDPESLGDFRQIVEMQGELDPSQGIGCQLYMSSDLEQGRIMASQKDGYFVQAEAILPRLVKGFLDPLGFYDIPDPTAVDGIVKQAANVPTELFVLIQSQYDPEYLFLPEINYFFFRYPRLHTPGTGPDAGFGFVQVSAFLLDNRENRIVSRGAGVGIDAFKAGDVVLDENYVITQEQQMETMFQASAKAVECLLKTMKMVK